MLVGKVRKSWTSVIAVAFDGTWPFKFFFRICQGRVGKIVGPVVVVPSLFYTVVQR